MSRRDAPSVTRRSASSATSPAARGRRGRGLSCAALEADPQQGLVEVAADEHHAAGAVFAVAPGPLEITLQDNVHRLEHQGWIAAEWGISELGRRSRFYRLTAAGRKQLGVETESWARLTAAIGRVLEQA